MPVREQAPAPKRVSKPSLKAKAAQQDESDNSEFDDIIITAETAKAKEAKAAKRKATQQAKATMGKNAKEKAAKNGARKGEAGKKAVPAASDDSQEEESAGEVADKPGKKIKIESVFPSFSLVWYAYSAHNVPVLFGT